MLDHSAKTLYITELARGMSLLLKVMLEPKVTVRAAPTLTQPYPNPRSSSQNTPPSVHGNISPVLQGAEPCKLSRTDFASMPDFTTKPPESSSALKFSQLGVCLASPRGRSLAVTLLQVRVGRLTRRVRRARSLCKRSAFRNHPELRREASRCSLRLSFTPSPDDTYPNLTLCGLGSLSWHGTDQLPIREGAAVAAVPR